MSGAEGIDGLRATIGMAIGKIGEMQSALSLSRDRGLNARDVLRIGTESSSREETAAAQAALQNADRLCEEAITSTLLAVEKLQEWLDSL